MLGKCVYSGPVALIRKYRRLFQIVVWVWICVAWLMDALADPLPPPQRWNVLLIVSDDLNCDLGCYGDPFAKTPNIDRLAQRGMLFARAYCQYPLCNPSRTSFLTGLRPDTTQVFENDQPPRTKIGRVPFLPEYFHKNGYFTARVGKIAHETFEDAVKWDESKSTIPLPDSLDDAVKPFHAKASDATDEDEPDGYVARRAARILVKERDRPLFLAVGFRKPHIPLVAPRRYFELYPPSSVLLPEQADAPGVPRVARTHAVGRISERQARETIAGYYACVSFMDAQVGVLLDTLDQEKLADHTVVILMSDHGFHLGEHGLWAKQSLFEECTHVPLIVAVPGMERAGQVTPRLVEYVDLYPTLIQLCGLPRRVELEGASLVPLLADPLRPWKSAVFSQVKRQVGDFSGHSKQWDRFWDHAMHGPQHDVMGQSVETERFHYIEWGSKQVSQLYDLQSDPHEYTNLVSRTDLGEVRERMRDALHDGWHGALPSR